MPLEQFFREATHVILHHFTMKNQQCFTRVLLSPALPRDLGTAFCRIPPNLWRSLGLLVDDVLCISLSAEAERNDSSVVRNNRIGSTKRILCRARPLERSLTYGEENAHEITPLCYVDLFVTVPWNAPSDHDQQLPGVGILTKMSRPQVAAVVVFALCVSDNGLHTSNDRKRFLSFTRGENVDSMMRAVLHQLPLCIDCRIYLNFEDLSLCVTAVEGIGQQQQEKPCEEDSVQTFIVGKETTIGFNCDNAYSVAGFDNPSIRTVNRHSPPLLPEPIRDDIFRMIVQPIRRFREHGPKVARTCPRGILLKGAKGIALESVARAIASECSADVFHAVNASELLGSVMGQSEENIRVLFQRMQTPPSSLHDVPSTSSSARGNPRITMSVAMLFIDNIHHICGKRDQSDAHTIRVVGQMLTLLDGAVRKRAEDDENHLFVLVGGTDRPDSLDPAVRRAGRMDREFNVLPPSQTERRHLLQNLCASLPLTDDVDLRDLSMRTVGYLSEDLQALVREAAVSSLRRMTAETTARLPPLSMHDFLPALVRCQPSLQRAVRIEIPKVQWNEIGGVQKVKLALQRAVEWPLKHTELYKRFRVKPHRGILIYGPPGCGKTTIAKAVATSCGTSFIAVHGAEIYSPYLGSAEALLRDVFKKARTMLPCIIFLDEVDCIVGKRSLEGRESESSGVQERILSTLLNEMDGVEAADGVLVLAATNRVDMLDPALLRPGRMDEIIEVPLPDLQDRLEILNIHLRAIPIGDDVCLHDIAKATRGKSAADLENICREAAILSLRADISSATVSKIHFDQAIIETKETDSGKAALDLYQSVDSVPFDFTNSRDTAVVPFSFNMSSSNDNNEKKPFTFNFSSSSPSAS